MKKVTLFVLVLLLVGLFAVPTFAQDMMANPAVHTECEVDLTGETITIYHFGDLSGAYAFLTQPLVAAYDDATKYFTENGGICGATFTHLYEDTGGDLEATQSAYDRFTSEYGDDLDLLILYSSPDSELLREQVAEDGIVVFISAGSVEGLYGEDGQTPAWLFASNPLYLSQFGDFCEFVAENPDTFPEPVIGHITWPGAFGEAAATPEADEYCTGLGVEVIDEKQIFLPTDTDILTQVQNLLDQGANILYTNTLASGPALVASTLVDLGMEEDVKLAGVNWVMDTSVGILGQRSLKANGMPSVDGIYGSMPFLWWTETSNPSVQFINQQWAANSRTLAERNIAYLLSWGSADVIVETYIQTVNRVGSLDAITGADLRETIEAMDYSVLGGLWQSAYPEGFRDAVENRIAQFAFLNAAGDGPATGPDDASFIEVNGNNLFVPIIIPLTDFQQAPNLRPGGM